MEVRNREEIEPSAGDDGSIVRELASPHNSALTRHSLAEIRHPPGTASQEHYHTEAEEVWDAKVYGPHNVQGHVGMGMSLPAKGWG